MTFPDLPPSLSILSPELLLIGGGALLALHRRSRDEDRRPRMSGLLAVGCIALTAAAWRWVVPAGEAFGGRLVSSELTQLLGWFLLGGAFLTLLSTTGRQAAGLAGRRLPLFLWTTAAALLVLRAQDLVPLAVALAVASLGLAGCLDRGDSDRVELGQQTWTATAAILFATAILYGETGATEFDALGNAFSVGLTGSPALATLGLVLLLVALLWRGGLVPFHRQPIEILGTASPPVFFLSTMLRVLGLLVIARLLPVAVQVEDLPRFRGILVLGAASMMLGALVAVARRDLAGTFGYLLLAHLGMAILPLASPQPELRGLIYAAATAIAATVATGIALARLGPRGSFSGAGRQRPWTSIGLLLALAALSGLPGTSGFGCAWSAAQWALREDLPILAAGVFASCCLGLLLTLRIGRSLFLERVDRAGQDEVSSAFTGTAGSGLAQAAAGAALVLGGVLFLLRLS